VHCVDERGDSVVYDDKNSSEALIAQYFTEIYKRPPHMRVQWHVDYNINDNKDMVLE